MAGLSKSMAGRAFFADLVRGIADQTLAAVTVMLARVPGRDAGRLTIPFMANQSAATIGIDLASFGVSMTRFRAIPMGANESVAAVVIALASVRHRGAARHAPAAVRIAAQTVTARDAISAGHPFGPADARIAGAILANDVRPPRHAKPTTQSVVRWTANGYGVVRIAPAATGTVLTWID